ncbi:MAG TPA: hypothetical protein VIW67_15100 [Terriglobales bacterium]|jgi:hypothetical protein
MFLTNRSPTLTNWIDGPMIAVGHSSSRQASSSKAGAAKIGPWQNEA